jgi:protein-tyrosine phosphatase
MDGTVTVRPAAYRVGNVIDLHCHVLPGIDDGPRAMEDAVALGRAQEQLGVTTVVATPHVSWDYPHVEADLIAEGVEAVNAAFAAEGLGVRVLPGAEVALTRAVELSDEELGELTLGGGPWLLLEPPHSPAAVAGTESAIVSLMHRGHQLVIAHPERCPAFLTDRPALERLVGAGALTSLTAGSLIGRFGRDIKRYATGLVADGLTHDIASDAHGASQRRPPGMAAEMEESGFGGLTDWLCRSAPEAILDGSPLPPRPDVDLPRRGGALARLLRRA